MNTILFPKCCFNCRHLMNAGHPACDICYASEQYLKWEPVVDIDKKILDKEFSYG